MQDKEPQNCWEFWDCPGEVTSSCPAYVSNSGRECWLVASHMCPKIRRDFDYCWDCGWFKKLNKQA